MIILKLFDRQTTTSQTNEIAQKTNVDNDFNISKKLIDNSTENPVISVHEDVIKTDSKPIKKLSLFEQNSDDEDLFAVKSSNNISVSKLDISKLKENVVKNIKSSRAIFSESDSDDEFMNSKPTSKQIAVHSIIASNPVKVIDSSSDDDLFNIKHTKNKSTSKSKSPIREKNVPSQEIVNEQKKNPENSKDDVNNKAKILSSPNNSFLKNNIKESSNMNDHIIQSNRKSSVSQHKKKLSNLFSSDEDDLDDNTFFTINKSNKNNVKKDQTKLFQSMNDERSRLKVEIFDSSSDDDIFNINKSNNNLKNSKLSDNKETQNIEAKTNIDNAIIDQAQKNENEDKINVIGKNIIDRTNTNDLSLLSDNDEEDDDYLFFDKKIVQSRPNMNNIQKDENIKVLSTPGEMLSPQMEPKNKYLSSENLLVCKKNNNLFDEDTSNNKISHVSRENTIQNNKSSIFSNSDNEQQLDLDINIQNENIEKKTEIIHTTSNSLSENVIDSKTKESFDTKVIDPIIGFQNETFSTPTENISRINKSAKFSSSDDERKSSFNSSIQNENSKKNTQAIHTISDSKDSIDGSSFSLPCSNSDTPKKLPGINNFFLCNN